MIFQGLIALLVAADLFPRLDIQHVLGVMNRTEKLLAIRFMGHKWSLEATGISQMSYFMLLVDAMR